MEWFRSFNCWPLPLLTLSMCLIETYYYVSLSMASDHNDALHDTGLVWTPITRNETHRFISSLPTCILFQFRWFTYSFLHVDLSHFLGNILLQIMVGLWIEMEHKVMHQFFVRYFMILQCVRLSIIYVIGVISGSLFHSVASPCEKLAGSSGGVFALLGAGVVKIKRQRKYKGWCRELCNLVPSLLTLILALHNLGSAFHDWWNCETNGAKTAISAHLGGFTSGLAVGWVVLNKYQESWRQEKTRGNYQVIRPQDARCCNIGNFHSACIHNPDVKSLFTGSHLYKPIAYKDTLNHNCMLITINFMIKAGE